jgi:hypothetical protein
MPERGGADDEGKSGLPEITKKILSLGLGAYFLTEDAIRRTVKDAKLPREIGKSLAQNASKGKEELFGFVARELSGFLRQMDLQRELDRFVQTHKIRASVEIEFLPRGGAAAPAKEEKRSRAEDKKYGKSDVSKIEPDDELDPDEPDDDESGERESRSDAIDLDVKFIDRRKPSARRHEEDEEPEPADDEE